MEKEYIVTLKDFNESNQFYNDMEGKGEPTSLTRTVEVSTFCESLVKSIDDLIKEHVTFQ